MGVRGSRLPRIFLSIGGIMATMLSAARMSLKITTTAYDAEIERLIDAAFNDLRISGIFVGLKPSGGWTDSDPLLTMAVLTYCRMRFGSPEDYDNLKAAYDEQKAQLQSTTGYGFLPLQEVTMDVR